MLFYRYGQQSKLYEYRNIVMPHLIFLAHKSSDITVWVEKICSSSSSKLSNQNKNILLFFQYYLVVGLHHSCIYEIQVILSPLIWFILRKNLLYSGRICAYEADKSLRLVISSRLRLFNGLLFCRSSQFMTSCLFTSLLPTSNHCNFKNK